MMSLRSTLTNHARIMVIGDDKVGKSALVVKYLTGRFITEYQSDHDWKYSYQTEIDGEEVHMEIIDSLTMDECHMTWAEGFLVVYDITSRKSLNHIEKLKTRIEKSRESGGYAMVVVGNKTDLEHCRGVEQETASQVASRIGASSHVMCSACGSESDIRFVFDELCREVASMRAHTPPAPPPPQPTNHKPERRRRSLAQVRQGLKMLVYTGGKNKSPSSVTQNSSSKPGQYHHHHQSSVAELTAAPNCSSSARKLRQNATIMSAPVINQHDERTNVFLSALFPNDDSCS